MATVGVKRLRFLPMFCINTTFLSTFYAVCVCTAVDAAGWVVWTRETHSASDGQQVGSSWAAASSDNWPRSASSTQVISLIIFHNSRTDCWWMLLVAQCNVSADVIFALPFYELILHTHVYADLRRIIMMPVCVWLCYHGNCKQHRLMVIKWGVWFFDHL